MFSEQLNDGMTKLDSSNVEFLQDEFPSVGEIKKNPRMYELQQDGQLSLSEGENLNTHQIIKDSFLSTLPMSDRNIAERHTENLSTL